MSESVDPDAVAALVQSTGASRAIDTVDVSFDFAEHNITVRGTGGITVRTADSDR
ncbi:HalOD1 output domain-containing protein [Halobaculum halobium]|uniref:HalOD1 output domain-containing protein n=1 Tax=Halobaculum halobium TaxID=3032281 RepID=UPI003D8109A3